MGTDIDTSFYTHPTTLFAIEHGKGKKTYLLRSVKCFILGNRRYHSLHWLLRACFTASPLQLFQTGLDGTGSSRRGQSRIPLSSMEILSKIPWFVAIVCFPFLSSVRCFNGRGRRRE